MATQGRETTVQIPIAKYYMTDFNGYPEQGDNHPNTNSHITWRISRATQDRETSVQIKIAKYYMTDFNGYSGQENNCPNTNG